MVFCIGLQLLAGNVWTAKAWRWHASVLLKACIVWISGLKVQACLEKRMWSHCFDAEKRWADSARLVTFSPPFWGHRSTLQVCEEPQNLSGTWGWCPAMPKKVSLSLSVAQKSHHGPEMYLFLAFRSNNQLSTSELRDGSTHTIAINCTCVLQHCHLSLLAWIGFFRYL